MQKSEVVELKLTTDSHVGLITMDALLLLLLLLLLLRLTSSAHVLSVLV